MSTLLTPNIKSIPSLALKALRPNIHQEISARLTLIDYTPNTNANDGNYSVFAIDGESKINNPYFYNITFVSDEFIHIEDLSDTDIKLTIKDEETPSLKKYIYEFPLLS